MSNTRQFPVAHPRRIYPLPHTGRTYPLGTTEALFVTPGNAKHIALGDSGYPFREAAATLRSGLTIASAEYQVSGGTTAVITAGTYPDLITAAKFLRVLASGYFPNRTYTLHVVDTSGVSRTRDVAVTTDLFIAEHKIASANQRIRPFADAVIAFDPDYVSSASYSVSGASSSVKTSVTRRALASGTHSGGNNSSSLTDAGGKNFVALGVRVGDKVLNITDGSSGTVSSLSSNISSGDRLSTTLTGGTQNDFDNGDSYTVQDGSDIVKVIQNFEMSFSATGLHVVTLYVTDSTGTEVTDKTVVQV